MELELRPRRSPFESGPSKASLATPSCCSCCCCLNAIGFAAGAISSDLRIRAEDSGRSEDATKWFGIAGFVLVPAFLLILGIVALFLKPDPDFQALLVTVSVGFVMVHAAGQQWAGGKLTPGGIFGSVALAFATLVIAALEILLTVVTAGFILLLSPVSASRGAKMVRSIHRPNKVPYESAQVGQDSASDEAPQT